MSSRNTEGGVQEVSGGQEGAFVEFLSAVGVQHNAISYFCAMLILENSAHIQHVFAFALRDFRFIVLLRSNFRSSAI